MSEYIALGDLVEFGITTHHPSSGQLVNADETPRWYVSGGSGSPILTGLFQQRSLDGVHTVAGRYWSSFPASTASGFVAGTRYEVFASGKVAGMVGGQIVRTFRVDDEFKVDLRSISGIPIANSDYVEGRVWNAIMSNYATNNTFGSGVSEAVSRFYFADIELIRDDPNTQDEYGVQWFRNSVAISSGQITNPAISVFNGFTGAALISNGVLSYSSLTNGALYRTASGANITSSGVPYLVIASGTIDGATRVWQNVVGKE